MEQSCKNENTYKVKMEDESLQEPKENASVQTKEAKIQNIMEKVNFFLKKLHAQRLFWKPNNKNALC
jgi:hypothetical protein